MSISPQVFQRSLQVYDSLLTVRWGQVAGEWIIERKAVIGDDEREFLRRRLARTSRMIAAGDKREKVTATYRGVAEEHASAQVGRRVVLMCRELNDGVFNMLCLGDIKRYGGYSRYADHLDAEDAKRAADRERVDENKRLAQHKVVHDVMGFLNRRKGDAMANGERSLSRLLGVRDVRGLIAE